MILLVGFLSLLVTSLNGGVHAAAKGYRGARIIQAPQVLISDGGLGGGGSTIITSQGGGLDPASQVQEQIGLGGSGFTPNTALYRIGQSSVPYGLSGSDYYSYPAVRLTGGGAKGFGLGSGGLGGSSIITGQPTFLGGLGGGNILGGGKANFGRSYQIGASRIPFGASGLDFSSFPAGLLTGQRIFGGGSGGVSILSGKTNLGGGGGLGGGPIQFVFGDPSLGGFKGGRSRIVYRSGQSQVPFGLSGLDFGSYPANLVAGGGRGGAIVQEVISPGIGGGQVQFDLGDQQSHIGSGFGSGKSVQQSSNPNEISGLNSLSNSNNLLAQGKISGLGDTSTITQAKLEGGGLGEIVQEKVFLVDSEINGHEISQVTKPITFPQISQNKIRIERPTSNLGIVTGGALSIPRYVGGTNGVSSTQFTLGGADIIHGPLGVIGGDRVQEFPLVRQTIGVSEIPQTIVRQERPHAVTVSRPVGISRDGGSSNVQFTLGGTEIIREAGENIGGGDIQVIPQVDRHVTISRVPETRIQAERPHTVTTPRQQNVIGGNGGSSTQFTLGAETVPGQSDVISSGGGFQDISQISRPVMVSQIPQTRVQVERTRPVTRPIVGGSSGDSNVHFTLGGTDIIRGQGGVRSGSGGVRNVQQVIRPVTDLQLPQTRIQVERPRIVTRPISGAVGGTNVHFTLGETGIIRGQEGTISRDGGSSGSVSPIQQVRRPVTVSQVPQTRIQVERTRTVTATKPVGGGVRQIQQVRRPVTVSQITQTRVQAKRPRTDTITRPVSGISGGGGSNVHFTLGGTDIIRGQGDVIGGGGYGIEQTQRVSRPVTVSRIPKTRVQVERPRTITRPIGDISFGGSGSSGMHFTLGGTGVIREQGGVIGGGGGGGSVRQIQPVRRPVTVSQIPQTRAPVERPRTFTSPAGSAVVGGGGSDVHFTLGGTDIIRGQGGVISGGGYGIEQTQRVSRPVTVSRIPQTRVQIQRPRTFARPVGGTAFSGSRDSDVHFTLGGTGIMRGQGGVIGGGGGSIRQIQPVRRPVTVSQIPQTRVQVEGTRTVTAPRPVGGVASGGVRQIQQVRRPITVSQVPETRVHVDRTRTVTRPVGGAVGGGISNVHFTLGGTDLIRGQGGVIVGGGSGRVRPIQEVRRPVTVSQLPQTRVQVERTRPVTATRPVGGGVVSGDVRQIQQVRRPITVPQLPETRVHVERTRTATRPIGGTVDGGVSNVHFTLGGTDLIRGQGGVIGSGSWGVRPIQQVKKPVTVSQIPQTRVQVERTRTITAPRPVGGVASGGIRQIQQVRRPITVSQVPETRVHVERTRTVTRPVGGAVGGGISNVHFTLGGTDLIRGQGGVIGGGSGRVRPIQEVRRPVTISQVRESRVQVGRTRTITRPVGGVVDDSVSNVHFTLGGTDLIRGQGAVIGGASGDVRPIQQVRRPITVSQVPETRVHVERTRTVTKPVGGAVVGGVRQIQQIGRPVTGSLTRPVSVAAGDGRSNVHFTLGGTDIIRGEGGVIGVGVSGNGVQEISGVSRPIVGPQIPGTGIQFERPHTLTVSRPGSLVRGDGESDMQFALGEIGIIRGSGEIISGGVSQEIPHVSRPITIPQIPQTRIHVERPTIVTAPRPLGTTDGGGSSIQFTQGVHDVIRRPGGVFGGVVQEIQRVRTPVSVSKVSETVIHVERPSQALLPGSIGDINGESNVQFTLGGAEIIRGPGRVVSSGIRGIPHVSRPVAVPRIQDTNIQIEGPGSGIGLIGVDQGISQKPGAQVAQSQILRGAEGTFGSIPVQERIISVDGNGFGSQSGIGQPNIVQEKIVGVENGGFGGRFSNVSPAQEITQEKVSEGLFDIGVLGTGSNNNQRLNGLSQGQNTGTRVVQEPIEQILVR